MMLGAASGFASTVWMTAPDTASAAPANRHPNVRGRRTY